ncbi:MAG: 2,3,4,5-tetrahydropyridine-2,6-dicarboxylate N-succinyltransferase [Actinomycetaceae bacterium]|nr:2,3,4,5-tetrahydropyridine-2,6-dicarboxylate N-succinyltransferase [Actinomycetaceae bacterium]
MTRQAWGFGLATISSNDKVLDIWYPEPKLGAPAADAQAPQDLLALEREDALRNVALRVVQTVIDLDEDPQDTADVFLRFHLLSHRIITPNSCSLEGIYDILETVVWTHLGPCAAEDFATTRMRICAAQGIPPRVYTVGKFPRMTNYIIPSGVRIANADRVRLGAYLAEGTVVTHAAFVDFNAGTLGAAHIEGRINKGVTVDEGTSIGGGVSTVGDLSANEETRVSIGKNCRIGNNAGVGIALGDNCSIEEGLYIKRDDKITILPTGGISPGANGYIENPGVIKAKHLAGLDNIAFRRSTLTGAIVAVPQDAQVSDTLQEIVDRTRGTSVR